MGRSTWAVLLIAVVLVLPGCIRGETRRDGLFWTQDGLFPSVPESGTHAGFRFEGGTLADTNTMPGLPFENPFLDVAWSDFRLLFVIWTPFGNASAFTGVDQISLSSVWHEDRYEVTGFFRGLPPSSELRDLFLRFASNVTSADEPTLATWADEFAAGGPAVRVNVTIPFRVDALFEEFGGLAGFEWLNRTHSFPGTAIVGHDDWLFYFVLASHHGTRSSFGVKTFVNVDANGRVAFGRDGPDFVGEAAMKRLAQKTFDDLGWPAPTFAKDYWWHPHDGIL